MNSWGAKKDNHLSFNLNLEGSCGATSESEVEREGRKGLSSTQV